jgi:hypothetical protein
VQTGLHLAQDRDKAVGSCEHNTRPLGSLKGGEFLE